LQNYGGPRVGGRASESWKLNMFHTVGLGIRDFK